MSQQEPTWQAAAREMCETLADGLDVAGTIESADVFTLIGTTCLEVVIDATDTEGSNQAEAYRVLCDLLDTRLRAGPADEIVGCLLFATEPEAEALTDGLSHMTRAGGRFVPVIPLGRDQAFAMASASARMADLTDDATALIAAAAGQPTPGRAQRLLEDIDELIHRRLAGD